MRFLANLSRLKRPYLVKYLTWRLIRLRRQPRSSGTYWQLLGLTIAILAAAILAAGVAYGAVTPSLGSASFVPRLITAAVEMRPQGFALDAVTAEQMACVVELVSRHHQPYRAVDIVPTAGISGYQRMGG